MRFLTKVVHAGQQACPTTGAITTPIYQTSTYVLDKVGETKGYDYSRTNTPTKRALEQNLAALEGGTDCIVYGSGLAAVDALLHTLSSGDHVIACDDLYGGTSRLFNTVFSRHGITFDLVDMTDPEVILPLIKDETKYIFIETPTNPTLKLVDIRACADIAKEHNIPLVVDNTFQTPYFQKPFELGADIVVHSLTKFLSGHNDIIGGCVIARDEALLKELRFLGMSIGATLGPQDSWLCLRGIKTLGLRMDRHDENAGRIAEYLEGNPSVEKVIYPGLESHPQHELAKSQMTGFGGMISFELKGGVEAGLKCMNSVKLWGLAESLGGVESLITHPATMTHATVPVETRHRLGITDGFIRLSVGIEDVDDLIEDLDQAIKAGVN